MPAKRRVSWAKFRVSVVSAVAVIIFLTLAFLMTGGTLFQQEATIYLYVPDATGLDMDSPVRVDGIDVGKVQALQFARGNNPDRVVRIVLQVERGRLANLTPDSYAEIGSDSIIGDKFVDVSSGTAQGHLRSGEELRFKPPTDFMKSVDITQFQKQLRAVDAVLSDIEEGRSELGKFILGDQMYRDVLKRVDQIQGALQAAVNSTTDLGDALYSEKLYQRIEAPIEALDRQLAVLQSGQGIGALLRDDAEYQSLLHTVGELRGSIGEIRKSAFLQSDDLYVSWNRNVASMVLAVARFDATPEMETTSVYDNLTGMMSQWRKTIAEFREHPQRYLRLSMF